MEKDTNHYVESINHNPNWLNKITIESDKFHIDREYIYFLIQIYMQLSKDNSSTSSLRKLIITRLPRFEKLSM